jgi:ABC-type antimicrobial peptide transport system permease subunit
MYVPQAQAPTHLSNVRGTMPVFIIRGRADGDLAGAVTQAMISVDPALPRPEVFPIAQLVTGSLVRERFGAMLMSVLAALALALTAFGIYGTIAYTFQQRRREVGIRMALGARGREVSRLMALQGIAPVLAGLVLGVLASTGISQVVASFLWGVTPTDPMTLATVAAILLGVALLASWIPAREAANLDPVTTLTCE